MYFHMKCLLEIIVQSMFFSFLSFIQFAESVKFRNMFNYFFRPILYVLNSNNAIERYVIDTIATGYTPCNIFPERHTTTKTE